MILCKNCKHCKIKNCGLVSYRAFCKILPKEKSGVRLEKTTPNPRCPLKENKIVAEIGAGQSKEFHRIGNGCTFSHHEKHNVIKGYVQEQEGEG